MDTTRPSAMCVINVDNGPGGVRWALVSVNPDPELTPAAVERSRHRDAADVLARVSQFLVAAGLPVRSERVPKQAPGLPGRRDPCYPP